jgi:hypothetical protein
MNIPNLRTPHTHAYKTLTTLGKHSGSLGAYENGKKYKGGRVLFIGLENQRTSGQGTYVRWFFPSGSKAVSYIHILSRWYSKSSIRLICLAHVRYTICRAYVRWSPSYVSTTDSSVRQSDLAYVCPKV